MGVMGRVDSRATRTTTRGLRGITMLAAILGLASVTLAPAAEASPFSGTLKVEIGTLGGPSFVGAGSGISTAATVTIPSGVFSGNFTAPITANPPLTQIKLVLSKNGAGSFTGTPLAGTMPVIGVANVLANFGMGPITLVKVPFTKMSSMGAVTGGIGVGGMLTLPTTKVVTMVYWDGWSTGMKVITGLTATSMYHLATGMLASQTTTITVPANETRTGSDTRTGGGGGRITFVSPTKVTTTLTPPIAVWSTLIVPEPTAPILLITGAAVLFELGRRRVRRS
jgi:hypothetical protein